MPADVEKYVMLGRYGLNLRDHRGDLKSGELTDALNWQLSRSGDLVKRLGFIPFGSSAAAARILELGVLRLAGGTVYLVAYCADGKVYRTTDGTTWTQIATGLSTTARPSFVQYLDKIYWTNGVDALRSWDGTTVSTIASAPLGRHLAVWRNRLWIDGADRRSVWWSKATDPTDWTNTLNTVSFPNAGIVTGLATAPNIGSGSDGADGVLVFASDSIQRIVDDTDNAAGAIVGGANVLVDGGQGCVADRTIAQSRGRLYFLGSDGVYSTDGHSEARSESKKIAPLFAALLNYGQASEAIGIVFGGRYLLAFTTIGGTFNSRLLELYLDLPANEEGQYPWMAHDIPAAAWVRWPGATSDRLYFADASTGDTARVRFAFQGGSDADGDVSILPISASARTGGEAFGIVGPKQVRRIATIGRGIVTVAVLADYEPGVGEQKSYAMDPGVTDTWTNTDAWEGVWGPLGGAKTERKYYTKMGRHLSFEVRELSSTTGPVETALGTGALPAGAAAIEGLHITLIPIDC